jgi:spermidine synthase
MWAAFTFLARVRYLVNTVRYTVVPPTSLPNFRNPRPREAHTSCEMSVLHSAATGSGTLTVRAAAGLRSLFLDDLVQSEVWYFERRGGLQLALPWEVMQLMLLSTLALLHGREDESPRALVVGLGGGSLPRTVSLLAPALRVHSIELEPAVLEAATAWFGLKLDGRVTAEVAEAGSYLAETPSGTWDVIVLDAFSASGLAGCVADGAALRDAVRALKPDGVLIVDLHTSHGQGADSQDADYRTTESVLSTLMSLFPSVHRWDCASCQNVLAICRCVAETESAPTELLHEQIRTVWPTAAEACSGLDLQAALTRLLPQKHVHEQ